VLVGDKIGGQNNSDGAVSGVGWEWVSAMAVVTPTPQAALVSGVCGAAAAAGVTSSACGGGGDGSANGTDAGGGVSGGGGSAADGSGSGGSGTGAASGTGREAEHDLRWVEERLAASVILDLQHQRHIIELSQPRDEVAVASTAASGAGVAVQASLQYKQLTLMGFSQGPQPAVAAAAAAGGSREVGKGRRLSWASTVHWRGGGGFCADGGDGGSSCGGSWGGRMQYVGTGERRLMQAANAIPISSGSGTSSGTSRGSSSSSSNAGSQRAPEVWTHLMWAVKR
jgi:hypothetical protein